MIVLLKKKQTFPDEVPPATPIKNGLFWNGFGRWLFDAPLDERFVFELPLEEVLSPGGHSSLPIPDDTDDDELSHISSIA